MSDPTVDPVRLPGLSEDEFRLVNRLLDQLKAKSERNNLRASYYDGRRAVRQIGTVVPPQYYKLGLVLGWSAKAVDILARRCNLDGFVWPGGDLNNLGLRTVIDDNFVLSEASAAWVSALIHGVVFSVTTKGGDGEPASLIHFKDALNATGDWNGRTRRMDNLLSVTARDGDGKPTGLALYLYGQTITSQKNGDRWTEVDRSEHDWGVPVEALPYQPRIGRPLGRSRISRPVMSLHDQALRTVIRMEGHMDVYSFPEMWMLGADPTIFKNPDGSVKPVWQSMLARLKGVPDDPNAASDALARADIKQFAASSPEPHIDALKQQAQLFSGETSIPLTSLGVSDMSNPTSADSYIASREDLIAEAEGAMDDWTPPLRRTIMRALAIANNEAKVPEAWKTIDAKWRSPLYLSRSAEADAGSKQVAAVSWLGETSIGLKLIGLSEQDIEIAMSERSRANGRATLQSVLNRVPRTTAPAANGNDVATN